jgi:hypothetical protein
MSCNQAPSIVECNHPWLSTQTKALPHGYSRKKDEGQDLKEGDREKDGKKWLETQQ